MAIKISAYQVCDRCQKPYSEEHLDYGVPPPKYVRRALKMTDGAQEILSFQDLCEDCERVVDKLIKQMKLVTEPKVKERTKSEPLESKEQEEEPAPAPSASTTDF